jgi:hypothetical protein
LEAALVQTSRVFVAGVLHAAIGMVDEALRRISRGDRHVESLDGQTGFQVIFERPSHDLAREGVDDDGEVDEGFGESDIGYVGDPELIEAGRFEPTRQVGNDLELVPAVGGLRNRRVFVASSAGCRPA